MTRLRSSRACHEVMKKEKCPGANVRTPGGGWRWSLSPPPPPRVLDLSVVDLCGRRTGPRGLQRRRDYMAEIGRDRDTVTSHQPRPYRAKPTTDRAVAPIDRY